MIKRNIIKVGNSLAVLIPSDLSSLMGVEKGQSVYWKVVDGNLTILKEKENGESN